MVGVTDAARTRWPGMTTRRALNALIVTVAALGAGAATAAPASAGGIGDFLSPAFGTSCTNQHGAHAAGATTQDTGTVGGNLAGLPIGSPVNQCGGADAPVLNDLTVDDVGILGKTFSA